MPAVLLATCAELPDGDEDRAVLTTALSARGIGSSWAVWDDPAVDWARGPVVIRSTWDYTARRDEFVAWAGSVPVLLNPGPVVEWNSDKVYLRELAAAGVPVVSTEWAAPGEPVVLPAAAQFVVKPSVGAGSRGAGRFPASDRAAALAHAAQLHEAGRTVLAQPYLDRVDADGETALLYFDGRFSHAVRKGAMLAEGTVHEMQSYALYIPERITAREPSAAEFAVAAAALAVLRERFGAELLYTRVDLLPGPDGPQLVELEAVEPSLFLLHSPGAAERFVAALAARLSMPG